MISDCSKLALEISISFSKKFTPSVLIGFNQFPSDPLDGLIGFDPVCINRSIKSIKI